MPTLATSLTCLKPPDSKCMTRTRSLPTTGWGRQRSTSSRWLPQPKPTRPRPSQILCSLTNGWQKMASGSRGTAPSPSSTARWSRWWMSGFRMLSVASLKWSSSASLSLNNCACRKGLLDHITRTTLLQMHETRTQPCVEVSMCMDCICKVEKEYYRMEVMICPGEWEVKTILARPCFGFRLVR